MRPWLGWWATSFLLWLADAYAAATFGEPLPPLPPPGEATSPFAGALTGAACAVAAAALAALALFRERLPGGVRRMLGGGIGVFLRPLRALHSGRVGDYVTWTIVGAAALGCALLLVLE